MGKEEYIKYIKEMLSELNERDLRQIYIIAHRKFTKRKEERCFLGKNNVTC